MSKSEKLPRRIIWSIILLSFSGELAWAVENQFFNLFIYKEIAPVPLYVSLLVAITAVVSTVTTILMGALSDVRGKRKVFLLIGYIFWTITTAIFPIAGLFQPVWLAVTIAIIFDSIMTFFGATANDATLNAYVTDVTTLENRGKVSSLKEIMFMTATLIVYAFSSFLIETFDFYSYFYIIAILVGIFGIPGALITPEPKDLKPNELGFKRTIKRTFTIGTIKANKDLFIVLISVGLSSIAFNIFFPFVLIYLQYELLLDPLIASLLIFIALLTSIIAAYPMGKLVDKIGRKKIGLFAIIIESIGLLLFAFSRIEIFLAITSSLWVFGMLSYNIATKTWLKDLYPEDKRGQFHGYFLLFSVLIGMTIGPLIGGLIAEIFGTPYIDPETTIPGFIPPPILFIIAGIMMLLALIPLFAAKEVEK
ncbi:MAG: MFS transporter [Candidatus Hermodarchaeota archaeon]